MMLGWLLWHGGTTGEWTTRAVFFRAFQSTSFLRSLVMARQKFLNCFHDSALYACRMRKLRRTMARLISSGTVPSSAPSFRATRDLQVRARCVFHQQPADSAPSRSPLAALAAGVPAPLRIAGSAGLADEGPDSNACSVDLPRRRSLYARRNARVQSVRTSPSGLGPCGMKV